MLTKTQKPADHFRRTAGESKIVALQPPEALGMVKIANLAIPNTFGGH